ncbi:MULTISPECIES: beta-ketoacyl synthase N-terminal-like domain-containing protein [Desulfobacula]|uniref:Beta-ketoacyl synthase related protein n=2 Tax=Desulfobacula TaxID=28222 RepID=K0NSN6_DESTT|nr:MULTISPECIES: beta-ketoacyl synthase N-terminal-like domain-containing protein [Desulfobacula]CCK82012.1 beta-ketoacyl synthase related protein [Desulfobacula toluolica Tol2]SDU43761.1 Beta-ketoacyl synthase, N-terminal domain [Desulfobacula phenolica]
MDYYICGIGFVTPESFGCGRDFKTFNPKPGKLSPITRKDVLEKPYKPFGRMDFFSKIGFTGAYFAYKDAQLITAEPVENNKTSNTAIVVSTHFRCLDTDNNYFQTIKSENGKNASPALFAYALPNAFLGETSIYLKTTGQCFAINEDSTNGITALKMTFDILNSEESEIVICGVCDVNIPKILEKQLNNRDDCFAGSLFFTISKKEQKHNYGKIKEDENGNFFFNEKNIESLLDLAQVCIENNKLRTI